MVVPHTQRDGVRVRSGGVLCLAGVRHGSEKSAARISIQKRGWTWANFGVDVWPDGRNIPFWITCDSELCGFVMLSPGSNPEELVKVSRFALTDDKWYDVIKL